MKCCFVCTRICTHTSTHTEGLLIEENNRLVIDRGLFVSGRQYVTFTLSFLLTGSYSIISIWATKNTDHTHSGRQGERERDPGNLQLGRLLEEAYSILSVFYRCKAVLSIWNWLDNQFISKFMVIGCFYSVSADELPVDVSTVLLSVSHSLLTHMSQFFCWSSLCPS